MGFYLSVPSKMMSTVKIRKFRECELAKIMGAVLRKF